MNEVIEMYSGLRNQTGFMKHYLTLYSMVEGIEYPTFEFGTGISTKMIVMAQQTNVERHHISNDLRDLSETGLDQEFIDANLNTHWTFIQGDSRLISIPEQGYGFVLHDGSHIPSIVHQDLKRILPYMMKGSVLAVHDTKEPNTALEQIVKQVTKDINCELLTLPYGYGLTLVHILEDSKYGEVEHTWKKRKAWK